MPLVGRHAIPFMYGWRQNPWWTLLRWVPYACAAANQNKNVLIQMYAYTKTILVTSFLLFWHQIHWETRTSGATNVSWSSCRVPSGVGELHLTCRMSFLDLRTRWLVKIVVPFDFNVNIQDYYFKISHHNDNMFLAILENGSLYSTSLACLFNLFFFFFRLTLPSWSSQEPLSSSSCLACVTHLSHLNHPIYSRLAWCYSFFFMWN